MQYLYEKDLKSNFWNNYKNRRGLIRSQFEAIREGGVDLLTFEKYQDQYQICAFEFKLSDIKKALAQAEYNMQFSHKSFIVIPIEKEKLINDKYVGYLNEKKYIGVIGVELSGRWKIIYQPKTQESIVVSQAVFKFLLNEI